MATPALSRNGAKAASPMHLSIEEVARLYKLTLQASNVLRREVTPTAFLRAVINCGLSLAEQEPDFARRVRDCVSLPCEVRWKARSRTRAQPPPSPADSTTRTKKGSRRDLGRRR